MMTLIFDGILLLPNASINIVDIQSYLLGGSNPIFPQDTPKFGFGDGQKWGKKYMEREGNKLSIFKIEKIPIFSHDAPKFGDGKKCAKRGKIVYGKRGKMYSL